MTVLPVRSIRLAPRGDVISPFLPTFVIVPFSTRNAESATGALPSPAISRALSNRTEGADRLDRVSGLSSHSTTATSINPQKVMACRNVISSFFATKTRKHEANIFLTSCLRVFVVAFSSWLERQQPTELNHAAVLDQRGLEPQWAVIEILHLNGTAVQYVVEVEIASQADPWR